MGESSDRAEGSHLLDCSVPLFVCVVVVSS